MDPAVKLSALYIVAWCCACGSHQQHQETLRYTKYTLAQCIAKAYPDTPVATDARAALGGYLENGDLEADAYADATTVAISASKQHYEGLDGEPLHVAKCLDLIGSPELEALLNKHIRQ
jgi:hypothetical protein